MKLMNRMQTRFTYLALALALTLCLTGGACQIAAVPAYAAVAAPLATQQQMQNAPITSRAFTVETELTITADLDSLDGIWFSALKQEDQATPVLAVTWSPTDSWFGPIWGLQLVTSKSLFPATMQVRQSDGFLQGYEYLALSSQQPVIGHTYNCQLGFTPAAGFVSVRITDTTANQVLLEQSVQLKPFEGALLPYMGIATQELSATPPAKLSLVQVSEYNLPTNLNWWLTQPQATTDYYHSVETVDRRLATQMRIATPWEPLPGTLEFTLESPGTVKPVLTVAHPQSAEYVADFSDVAPGSYQLIARYYDNGRSWLLSQQQIAVGRVEYELLDVAIDRTAPGGPIISGSLRVDSDGPLPDIALNLDYSLTKHTFQPNQSPGMGTILSEQVTKNQAVFPLPLSYSGTTTQMLPFSAPLGEVGDNDSVWQITIQPYSTPATYSTEAAEQSIWVGRTIAPQAWTGYLSNEKQTQYSIAPGIVAYHVSGAIAAGPLHMYILEVDLDTPGVTVDGLAGRHYVSSAAAVTWPRSQISRLVTDEGAVAGVNASFFEISSTMLPTSMLMRSFDLLRTPDNASRGILGITADNQAYIGNWIFSGQVHMPAGVAPLTLNAINPSGIVANSVNLYRAPFLKSPGNQDGTAHAQVTELILQDVQMDTPGLIKGQVAQVRQNQPGINISGDIMVLSSRDVSARLLAENYRAGDEIVITYAIRGGFDWPWLPTTADLKGAASGGVVLLKNGLYGANSVHTDTARHPRTAAAISADRKQLYLFVFDGRTQASVGVTYKEMADYFLHMGAFEALNLDGGGSSTFSVRLPATGQVNRLNTPSDGAERYVADGVGVFYTTPVH